MLLIYKKKKHESKTVHVTPFQGVHLVLEMHLEAKTKTCVFLKAQR